MAEQGGYRTPSPANPPSGPGRFSRRTDNQKVAVPNVGDAEDLNQGDRQRLEAAQRLAPVPGGKGPVSGFRRGRDRGAASLRDEGGIPQSILQELTKRPQEPETTGLSTGPGAGPEVLPQPPPKDDRELVLEYYQDLYSNSEAAQWLAEIRQPPAEVPVMSPAPVDISQQEPLPEDDIIDFDAGIEAEQSGIPTEEEEATESDPLSPEPRPGAEPDVPEEPLEPPEDV